MKFLNMEVEAVMKAKLVRIIVFLIFFLGVFSLKNFSISVDKAYARDKSGKAPTHERHWHDQKHAEESKETESQEGERASRERDGDEGVVDRAPAVPRDEGAGEDVAEAPAAEKTGFRKVVNIRTGRVETTDMHELPSYLVELEDFQGIDKKEIIREAKRYMEERDTLVQREKDFKKGLETFDSEIAASLAAGEILEAAQLKLQKEKFINENLFSEDEDDILNTAFGLDAKSHELGFEEDYDVFSTMIDEIQGLQETYENSSVDLTEDFLGLIRDLEAKKKECQGELEHLKAETESKKTKETQEAEEARQAEEKSQREAQEKERVRVESEKAVQAKKQVYSEKETAEIARLTEEAKSSLEADIWRHVLTDEDKLHKLFEESGREFLLLNGDVELATNINKGVMAWARAGVDSYATDWLRRQQDPLNKKDASDPRFQSDYFGPEAYEIQLAKFDGDGWQEGLLAKLERQINKTRRDLGQAQDDTEKEIKKKELFKLDTRLQVARYTRDQLELHRQRKTAAKKEAEEMVKLANDPLAGMDPDELLERRLLQDEGIDFDSLLEEGQPAESGRTSYHIRGGSNGPGFVLDIGKEGSRPGEMDWNIGGGYTPAPDWDKFFKLTGNPNGVPPMMMSPFPFTSQDPRQEALRGWSQ